MMLYAGEDVDNLGFSGLAGWWNVSVQRTWLVKYYVRNICEIFNKMVFDRL